MHIYNIEYLSPDKKISEDVPVLYRLYFGHQGHYLLWKGKKLNDSVESTLSDIFRGFRDKSHLPGVKKVVEFLKIHATIRRVAVEVVYNGKPELLLKKEEAVYKQMRKDKLSLNNFDIEIYKPEWMLKASAQQRCKTCVLSGVINKKTTKFKFCPNCGRLNK